jgi:phage gp29-like protein
MTFPLTISVVQAALPRQVVGVATSQIQFWRNLGGTVGTAVLGSILARELPANIQSRIAALHLPPQVRLPSGSASNPRAALDPAHVAQVRSTLPQQVQPLYDQVVHAMRLGLGDALHQVFLIGAGILVVALVATVFLKEVPLGRRSDLATEPNMPVEAGSAIRS